MDSGACFGAGVAEVKFFGRFGRFLGGYDDFLAFRGEVEMIRPR